MTRRRFAHVCWTGAALVLIAYGAARAAGFLINTTESLPVGLWRAIGKAPIERGVVATVTPPDNEAVRLFRTWGYAGPHGWLKPIAAIPGDVVEIHADGARVNGRLLANSAQITQDVDGHVMPRIAEGRYVVAPGTVWLLSDYNPLSLDSRYIGPVPIANIGREAIPVWVHQGPPAND